MEIHPLSRFQNVGGSARIGHARLRISGRRECRPHLTCPQGCRYHAAPFLAPGEIRITGLSQRLVNYIAALKPLCTFQFADGHDCALSLADGTLYMPVDESHHETEEGWIAVLWQGDAHRRSELPGPLLAYHAALRCAELQRVGKPEREISVHREMLLVRLRDICGKLPHIKMTLHS